jgi:ABC-type glycerol-3-phosphate transport system substrate-binding protein
MTEGENVMNWIRGEKVRRWLIASCALVLLVLSLLLVACGSRGGASSTGGSNISTNGTTQQTTTTTSSGSDGDLQKANQQVQTAVSGVDSGQNDVNNADASSNNDDGQQP